MKEKPLPPITWRNVHKNINWVSFVVLTVVPILSFYGAATTKLQWQTALWAVIYYFYTGLGITAGYHRLWAHRAYNAGTPLQFFLMFGGSGAVEGSIRWWCRGHRAHHRYTDTELDPYSAHKGFWWSHIGWMIFKGRRSPGVADVSDLTNNPVVRWQHKYYLPLIVGMGFLFPMSVAGLLWGDWRGGFFFAGAARLLFVHHSTFCVNSLAHWLGDTPFDDKNSPRDHWITALVTVGEGYVSFVAVLQDDLLTCCCSTISTISSPKITVMPSNFTSGILPVSSPLQSVRLTLTFSPQNGSLPPLLSLAWLST